MITSEEIIKRLNEIEVEKIKLIGKLELLEEQKKPVEGTAEPKKEVETSEATGL